MTLAQTAALMAAAEERGGAVPAFNVITLEHAEGIVEGAQRSGTDVVLQLSQNAIRFHGLLAPIAAACRALAEAAGVSVAIHLDHIDDVDLVDQAVRHAERLGISSIMIDASALPYERNVTQTYELGRRAHDVGMWVEAELGEIGGKDGAHAPGVRTDPNDAASFVEATGVDGLAVAVGSSHAMATRTADIDVDLIRRLARALPVPLVLHGSSGVPDAAIAQAVAAGIRKVNVGTALNVAYSRALRTAGTEGGSTDPRASLREARTAIADTVDELCRVIAG